jgi:hypothetical protein
MAVKQIVGAMAVLLLAACASKPSREDVMMDELVTQLAGSYDNIAQSRASPDHPSLRLVIAPVRAPLVGEHVFYVQEMASDDLRRVLAQRLYVVTAAAKGEQALLAQLDFSEPLRWRDGHLNRDLFRSLLMQDLRQRNGCDLLWQREGAGFTATTGAGCRTVSRTTGEGLKVEQKFKLDPDGIAVLEQHRDAAGVLVSGDEADPWFRYARRGDAPW